MQKLIIVLAFLKLSTFVTAQPNHAAFDALLKKYVTTAGKVNYKGFKQDKTALETYIKSLADNTPTDKWSKAEKMAYWINAYNALTIKLIIDSYPLSSIQKLDNGKTWDVKRFKLGAITYSLNGIENEILRPMGDARIHFAINCAAKSCPALASEAFTSQNLQSLLESRTKRFINDPKSNILKGKDLKISKIFEWYSKDFYNVHDFINRYAVSKIPATANLGYTEYDWSLNE